GLARVGEADEADVRDGLELQGELALLPRLALEREPRGLALLRREGRVAEAAAPACRRDEPRAGADEVGEDLAVLAEHDRAAGDLDHLVLARAAVSVRALALVAVARLADRAPVEVKQRRRRGVDLQDHAAAAAPVAAVRAAERLELLPVHRRAAMAAVASLHPQHGMVSELRHVFIPSESL